MSIIRIDGGKSLEGTVSVHGAKNSVLPILAASLLASGETVIHNCPDLSDVDAAVRILVHLGCTVSRDGDGICIDSSKLTRCDIPHVLMREMRSSVIFLGAILSRRAKRSCPCLAAVSWGRGPSTCTCPHFAPWARKSRRRAATITCKAAKLEGCRINLSFPSVGATENAMLAATGCTGTTVITNAACEPEIWDLQCYLRRLGVNVWGREPPASPSAGGARSPARSTGSFPTGLWRQPICLRASSGGSLELRNVCPEHVRTVTDVLSEMGCEIIAGEDTIRIDGGKPKRAVRPIVTKPYPGFPTDAQPPILAVSLTAEGTTVFVENIFESRYRHVAELQRLGADIKTEGRVAIVSGVKKLYGAPITTTDLRGGAALIVAALGAEGTTEITDRGHIDRGYDDIVGVLKSLGAQIIRFE
jgi:UDP-N-acetylglucosamine 1-carboxyvinyltransferase